MWGQFISLPRNFVPTTRSNITAKLTPFGRPARPSGHAAAVADGKALLHGVLGRPAGLPLLWSSPFGRPAGSCPGPSPLPLSPRALSEPPSPGSPHPSLSQGQETPPPRLAISPDAVPLVQQPEASPRASRVPARAGTRQLLPQARAAPGWPSLQDSPRGPAGLQPSTQVTVEQSGEAG